MSGNKSDPEDAEPGPSSQNKGEQFRQEINYRAVKHDIDLESLVSRSLTTLKLPKVVDANKTQSQIDLSSLVRAIESRALTSTDKIKDNNATSVIIHPLDVLDYFAAKDGLKYLGFIEQLQYSYDNKCKALLYDVTDRIREEVEAKRKEIAAMSEYRYIAQDQELHDYDFPIVAEKIVHCFPIDASRKLHEIAKFHNYGIKMVLHWVYVIQRQTKPVDSSRIEEFATELLADIMVPAFGLFIHFAEFIICMADAPPPLKEGYPLEALIGYLRRFYEALALEYGAIAESVGEVMVRIPGVDRELVVEKMTKVYYAVNHCSYSSCKFLEAMAPMLLYYEIRVILGDAAPTDSSDTTPDFKRFTGHHAQHRKSSLGATGVSTRYRHSTGY